MVCFWCMGPIERGPTQAGPRLSGKLELQSSGSSEELPLSNQVVSFGIRKPSQGSYWQDKPPNNQPSKHPNNQATHLVSPSTHPATHPPQQQTQKVNNKLTNKNQNKQQQIPHWHRPASSPQSSSGRRECGTLQPHLRQVFCLQSQDRLV